MDIDEFADMTWNVIDEDGFDGFLPTACLPERKVIRALSGAPLDEPQEPIALAWVANMARPDEEVLVAFRHSETTFKIIRIVGSVREECVFAAVD